jgi:hypothetical protein
MDVKVDPILKLVSASKFDSTGVIVDRLTKSVDFIPINNKYRVEKYAGIYIAQSSKDDHR